MDPTMRQKLNKSPMPAPSQIKKNLQMVEMMRQKGHLDRPGLIHQRGVNNRKNETSSRN